MNRFPVVVATFFKEGKTTITGWSYVLKIFGDAARSAALAEVSGDILREGITALVYFAIAFIGFVYFEHVVKLTGSLDRAAM